MLSADYCPLLFLAPDLRQKRFLGSVCMPLIKIHPELSALPWVVENVRASADFSQKSAIPTSRCALNFNLIRITCCIFMILS